MAAHGASTRVVGQVHSCGLSCSVALALVVNAPPMLRRLLDIASAAVALVFMAFLT